MKKTITNVCAKFKAVYLLGDFFRTTECAVDLGFDSWGQGEDDEGEFLVLTILDPLGAANNHKDQVDIKISL